MSNYYAIIPAAGSGTRFKGLKQFLKLEGKTLLEHALTPFVESGWFKKIIVCLPLDFPPLPNLPLGLPSVALPPGERGFSMPSQGRGGTTIEYIAGGKSRFESVYKGFLELFFKPGDFVLIHDAARPLVSQKLIKKVMEALKNNSAVVPVLPLVDTIKKMSNHFVVETLDRSQLGAAQTPQGFSCDLLGRLYKQYSSQGANFTDEAMMVEASGEKVYVVEGEKENIKITTEEDLEYASWYWLRRS